MGYEVDFLAVGEKKAVMLSASDGVTCMVQEMSKRSLLLMLAMQAQERK